MQSTATLSEYLKTPIGHSFAGNTYVVWNHSPQLGGVVVWGRPSERDVEQIFLVVDAYHKLCARCDVVTDMSRIDSIDSTAYAALLDGMRARQPFYSERVRRHATVRTDGIIGGLAEGFYRLIEANHNWRIFKDSKSAFDWLEHADGEQVRLQVEQFVAHACGVAPELRTVRDFLKAHLSTVLLRDVAAALGLSERTLHRKLRLHGTSFRDELLAARIDASRRLLGETELKIEVIALRVGCCSHTHLTNLFRRRTGQTPAEYRAMLRSSEGTAEPPERPAR